MNLQRVHDVQMYETLARPFLAQREAEHNLLLGLAGSLAQGDRFEVEPYMALVRLDERVVAVVLRTPPFNVLLSHIDERHRDAVLALVAADVHAQYGATVRGVTTSKPLAEAFAWHWQRLTGQGYRVSVAQRIYQLEEVTMPSGVAGTMRPARPSDDVLRQWQRAFYAEALPEAPVTEEALQRFADTVRSPSARRGIVVWEVEGQPVAMAGYMRPTPHGMCIGSVYTPPAQRRHGYAGALVAALSQQLLESGRRFCFLYTDLANPTSNHIYQQIGYRPVCDVDEIVFEASG